MKIKYASSDVELQSKPELQDYAIYKLEAALGHLKDNLRPIWIYMGRTSDTQNYYCSVEMTVPGRRPVVETSIQGSYYQAVDDVSAKVARKARQLTKRHRSLAKRRRLSDRGGQPGLQVVPLIANYERF